MQPILLHSLITPASKRIDPKLLAHYRVKLSATATRVSITRELELVISAGFKTLQVMQLILSRRYLVSSAGKEKAWVTAFALISLVFAYTTVVNVIEHPDGIKIAGFFIALIIFVSLLSRIARTTELRAERFEIDETAQRFLDEAAT